MSCCDPCCGVDDMFDRRIVRAELARYRSLGPAFTTRRLLAFLRGAGVGGSTVLDIGGGFGAIALELIEHGAAHATLVDASTAYLDAARAEAERRNAGSKLDLVGGDFVALAPGIPAADVVTLDRVVCGYPEKDALIEASATRARRLYGIAYPRDSWWVRLAVRTFNALRRLRRKPFRIYVWPNAEIETAVRRAGLSLKQRTRGLMWVVDLYDRPPAPARGT